MRNCALLLLLLLPSSLFGQASSASPSAERGPIIDMHLHAYSAWQPTAQDSSWIPLYLDMPATDQELMRESLAELRRLGIVKAVTSGPAELVEKFRDQDPERIIPALQFNYPPEDPSRLLDSLRALAASGNLEVLGELGTQYAGLAPSDPEVQPYLALAEDLDIPVGIHMGPGPPGRAHWEPHTFRAGLSSPLLLEDALVRHPGLRVYVMHAGWPMLDDMVALLHGHPEVYVDVAVINWFIPREEFHSYLKRLVDAGYGKRIMFGSDQMNWPGAIELAIEGIESAAFLTEEQKRDIFYNNAARFLRLEQE